MKTLKTIKFKDLDFEMDVNVSIDDKTVWMSKDEMSILYQRDRSVLTRHIKKVLEEDCSYSEATCAQNAQVGGPTVAKNETVRQEGDRIVTRIIDYYNLDIIILVGQRVKSNRGLLLKELLDEYLKENSEIEYKTVRFIKENISLDVKVSPKEITVWLNQKQIAELFDTTQQNISSHISNILQDEELDDSVYKDFLYTAQDGKSYIVTHYNLDMIISVGYRVNSSRGVYFRRWATKILAEYLTNGYVSNDVNRPLAKTNDLSELYKLMTHMSNQVSDHDDRLKKLEMEKGYFPQSIIINKGTLIETSIYISSLVSSAKKNIILIDSYTSEDTLKLFNNKLKGVEVIIYTFTHGDLSSSDINTFNALYGGLVVYPLIDFHDRFLIIDECIFYFLGPSLKDAGNRYAHIIKIENEDLKDVIRKRFIYKEQ